jgi:putative redox protein
MQQSSDAEETVQCDLVYFRINYKLVLGKLWKQLRNQQRLFLRRIIQRPCAVLFKSNITIQRSIMGTATVKWITGKQFIGVDSTQHSVVLSTPDEGVGMKPSELLLVALASCTAVDVVEILAKKRTPINHLEIQATGEQDQDPPWTFRKIHLHYTIGGKGLTEKAVEQAIQLSEEKYCSVAATLRATAEIITEFTILQEELEPVA